MTPEAFRINSAADTVAEVAALHYHVTSRTVDYRKTDNKQWLQTHSIALRITVIEAHCWKFYDSISDRKAPQIDTDKAAEAITTKFVKAIEATNPDSTNSQDVYTTRTQLRCRRCKGR